MNTFLWVVTLTCIVLDWFGVIHDHVFYKVMFFFLVAFTYKGFKDLEDKSASLKRRIEGLEDELEPFKSYIIKAQDDTPASWPDFDET
mgnify:CR=1 FL=1|jgi:hypothetical protein